MTRARRSLGTLLSIGMIATACASGSADEAASDLRDLGDVAFVRDIPPPVDLSEHSVPLDQIIFDTFDGGSIPLPEATPEVRARLLDRIPPIDQPIYEDVAAAAWLLPDDLVLGYMGDDGVPRAYPIKILNFHEIVNDEIGGIPVLISYCPLCRSAIVYDRRVADDVLSFSNTSALHDSDMVMVDRETGSYWWQVLGAGIVGPLTDTELTSLPSEMASWADWAARHPDTLVLSRTTGFDRNYERDPFAGYGRSVDAGRFAFPVGDAANDERLPASTLVIAIEVDGQTYGYATDVSTEPFDDVIGETTVRITPHDGGATVADVNDDGSVGEAIASRTSFWFALVGAFPDIELRSAR